MTLEEESHLPKEINDIACQISENFVLGIRKKTELEPASFFNHSCNPNSGFKGQIYLIALKKIRGGEEITFDYGMVLHKAKGVTPYKLKCLCGSKNCREYITADDWKQPELQKRYDGYFQWYLQEKISKLRKK
jgi:hypothetical protein